MHRVTVQFVSLSVIGERPVFFPNTTNLFKGSETKTQFLDNDGLLIGNKITFYEILSHYINYF